MAEDETGGKEKLLYGPVEQGNRLPGEVVPSLSLEVFRSQPDKAPSKPVSSR